MGCRIVVRIVGRAVEMHREPRFSAGDSTATPGFETALPQRRPPRAFDLLFPGGGPGRSGTEGVGTGVAARGPATAATPTVTKSRHHHAVYRAYGYPIAIAFGTRQKLHTAI